MDLLIGVNNVAIDSCGVQSIAELVYPSSLALACKDMERNTLGYGRFPKHGRRFLNEGFRPTSNVCYECKIRKKKCEWYTGAFCTTCTTRNIRCILAYTLIKPFEKWTNSQYAAVFVARSYNGSLLPRVTEIQHIPDGPILKVTCVAFNPTDKNQTRLLTKDIRGWHHLDTSAYCLEDLKADISEYIDACVFVLLCKWKEVAGPVSFFFRFAEQYIDRPLVWKCLELYTCVQLLLHPLQLCGVETLDMVAIRDPRSPWYGQRPVPRQVSSQIKHLLEIKAAYLDDQLHSARRKSGMELTELILVYFFLLLSHELDAARNIFWKRYEDPDCFWQHPSRPEYLLEEATASCKQLLCDLRYVAGWDHRNQAAKQDDQKASKWIGQLKANIELWHMQGYLARSAQELYIDGEPMSILFTVSSRMFVAEESFNQFSIE
ncbi:hypothetical protein F5Y19DRAFT_488205 [Xylariaceae sp. FL1651]|nr:hypothetical protein F5Y19DRAFT_488205 [Xylariaceae sp. FL1651]